MLTPMLQRLLEKLERTEKLSDEQRALRDELRVINRDGRVANILREELTKSLPRIVSGPGACECCGR